WIRALGRATTPEDAEWSVKYRSCPTIVRKTLRSLSLRSFSQPSRAFTLLPSGNRKYLVLRYFVTHRDGLAAPSGAIIVLESSVSPFNTTLVPCEEIRSGFTESSTCAQCPHESSGRCNCINP